jgi:hypothetical protein
MMNKLKYALVTAAVLVLMSSVHAVHGQSTRAETNSAQSSRSSGTDARVFAACSAAADELKASRELTAAQDVEIGGLKEALNSERRTSALLEELDRTRKSEAEALRNAIAAKDEAIRTRDSLIATQDKLITALKNKKQSILRRVGDVLLGATVIAVIR